MRAAFLLPIALALLAAGCDRQQPSAGEAASVTEPLDNSSSAAVDDYLEEVRTAGAITTIDAASGDGSGMPADHFGPTAGEITERARERDRAALAAMARALDQAERVDVDLPDPVVEAEEGGGETSVVETE